MNPIAELKSELGGRHLGVSDGDLLTGWMVGGFCMTWCFIQLGGCRVAVGDLPENHPLFFFLLVCWKSI